MVCLCCCLRCMLSKFQRMVNRLIPRSHQTCPFCYVCEFVSFPIPQLHHIFVRLFNIRGMGFFHSALQDFAVPTVSSLLISWFLPCHGCKNELKNGLDICLPCGTRPKSTLESTTPWPPCARCSSWAAKQGFGWRSPVPCWALRCERWWRSNFQSNQVPRPPRW